MYAVYIFGTIMAILVAAVIFAPLVEGRWREGRGGGETAADRRDAAVAALRELEFEYQTGKVSEEDYATLRARYARQALAARDELGEERPGTACPSCGSVVRADARFCGACGTSLS